MITDEGERVWWTFTHSLRLAIKLSFLLILFRDVRRCISRKCHMERQNVRRYVARLYETRLGSAKVNIATRIIIYGSFVRHNIKCSIMQYTFLSLAVVVVLFERNNFTLSYAYYTYVRSSNWAYDMPFDLYLLAQFCATSFEYLIWRESSDRKKNENKFYLISLTCWTAAPRIDRSLRRSRSTTGYRRRVVQFAILINCVSSDERR